MPNRGQQILASVLGMPKDNIRIVSRYIGGGFGAKLTPQSDAILAALASKVVGRPVKIALTRRQVFHSTTHRSNTIQRIRLGADGDGHLQAVAHQAWSGNTPGDETFESAAIVTRSLYATPNLTTQHRLAALDLPVASSMRAPGEAVGMLAIRMRHGRTGGPAETRPDRTPHPQRAGRRPDPTRSLFDAPTRSLSEGRCTACSAGRNAMRHRGRSATGNGWSVSASRRRAVAIPSSPRRPRSGSARTGVAVVRMAMTDIGTGSYTVLSQIAGEMLGLPTERIRMELGDTDFPPASGSGGSFGAGSAGSALYDACMTMRAKLVSAAGMPVDGATFADGRVASGNRSATLASLAGADGIEAMGSIQPGDMHKLFSQQSYGAHFAEVGVDVDTGEIRLRRMLGVFHGGTDPQRQDGAFPRRSAG